MIKGYGKTSRDFCYVANAVQVNLLGTTAQHADPANQIYSEAVGDRTDSFRPFEEIWDLLAESSPERKDIALVFGDAHPGDVRHSLVEIGTAHRLLGYQPTHRIKDGLREAMHGYCAKR